jgi:hypothetical protein
MKTISAALLAGVTLFACEPALAQSSAEPVVIGGAPQAPSNILRSGTEVHLVTRTELTSQTSRVGERFQLEVTDPVTVNGQVVIPQGAIATGEVTRVQHRGMWGRRGILETRLIAVRVGDRNIRLTGAAGDRGHAGTAGVVAAVVVIPVVGFFVTGTSAVIPPRTPTVAYLDEDVPVVFAGPVTPAPLVVPAAQPVASPAPTVAATPAVARTTPAAGAVAPH